MTPPTPPFRCWDQTEALVDAVRKVMTSKGWDVASTGDLIGELYWHPETYGFAEQLQRLSIYQLTDRFRRARVAGLLISENTPGGSTWWSFPEVDG